MTNTRKVIIALDGIAIICAFATAFFIGMSYGKSLRIKYNPPTIIDAPKPSPNIHFHYYQSTPSGNKEKKLPANYSDADKYCMAQNIYFESANQSALGKLAVGLVAVSNTHLTLPTIYSL